MMKSVACIGQGFVGGSLTTVLSERGYRVYTYDKAGKQARGGTHPVPGKGQTYPAMSVKELVLACEATPGFTGVFFVCLPTPMFPDGSADLSIVEGVLHELSAVPPPLGLDRQPDGSADIRLKNMRIVVVKSTVPPGTTERWNKELEGTVLRVVFNPEFLTEANALDDMRNQDRIVIGGPRPWINVVKQVFQSAFPKVPVIKTSSTTAEMVKYVTNCFLATKVAFANEVAQVCEALDARGLNIDYDKVVEYAKLDKRLGPSHWAVPGPDGARGFGGHCFPKDINAMLVLSRGLGIDPTVMRAAWHKNLEVRTGDDRDWERMEGRAVSGPKDNVLFWSRTPGRFVHPRTGEEAMIIINGVPTSPNFTGDQREWNETLVLVIEDVLSRAGDASTVTVGRAAYEALSSSVLFQSLSPGSGRIRSTCKSEGLTITLDTAAAPWSIRGGKGRVEVLA